MKLILLSLLMGLFLCSCSGHVIVSPKRCLAKDGSWFIKELRERPDFVIEKKVYPVQERLVSRPYLLRDILEERGLKCINLHQVKVSVKQDWKDALISLVPFVTRQTIVVEGTLYEDQGN